MTDQLKNIIKYRSLLLALFAVMSSSFLIFPLGMLGINLFKVAIGINLIMTPLFAMLDIFDLTKAANESK